MCKFILSFSIYIMGERRFIRHWPLAHALVEAENSNDLPASTSWEQSPWYNSVRVQRPKIWGCCWCKPQSESKCLRTRSPIIWGMWKCMFQLGGKKSISLSSTFLFYQGLNRLDKALPHQGEWVSLPVYQFIC